MKSLSRLLVPLASFFAVTQFLVSLHGGLMVDAFGVQALQRQVSSFAYGKCTRNCRSVTTSSSTVTAAQHQVPPLSIPARTRSISLSLHDRHHQHLENDSTPRVSNMKSSFLATRTSNLLLALSLFLTISFSTALSTQPALASSYTNALSDEQKVVAEAWRLVDNSFLDRTFNGQDWFQLRQSAVSKKYKTMDEAHLAIDEMISTLGDKYTRYLSPAKYRSLVDSATGTLGSTGAGVGVQISNNEKGQIIANDVEPNSPASKAGIRPGDVFVEVDGVRFVDDAQATPDDVAARLRGPEGSKVGVVMVRNNGQETLDFRITRQPIKITAVQSYISSISGVPGKVGVVRIKSFSGTTATTVSKELEGLKGKGAQSFVIDVRGNPGGLLPGGVDTASLFLKSNDPIVFVVNKKGIVDAQSALATGMDTESPLVVLVDSATASAAEVFTAALQENGRATVAGEQTFGKGIVQTIRELADNNGGVAITVARYETPQHHDINKQGIPVDVPTSVSCPKDDATACLDAKVFRNINKKG